MCLGLCFITVEIFLFRTKYLIQIERVVVIFKVYLFTDLKTDVLNTTVLFNNFHLDNAETLIRQEKKLPELKL